MPGLPPFMNVLFLEQCDFHVSSLGRDMSGNVLNRPYVSSIVDMGSHQTLWSPPLQTANVT